MTTVRATHIITLSNLTTGDKIQCKQWILSPVVRLDSVMMFVGLTVLAHLYFPKVIITCVKIPLLITVCLSNVALVLMIYCGMHICCVLLIN